VVSFQTTFAILLGCGQSGNCCGVETVCDSLTHTAVAHAGYGSDLSPSPECASANVVVMFQAICSSLLDYLMMGVVFARWG
jgi:hypothetical protein